MKAHGVLYLVGGVILAVAVLLGVMPVTSADIMGAEVRCGTAFTGYVDGLLMSNIDPAHWGYGGANCGSAMSTQRTLTYGLGLLALALLYVAFLTMKRAEAPAVAEEA